MKQIPKNRIEVKKKANSKARCDGCNKLYRTKNIISFKGKFLCRKCRSKLDTFRYQMSASNYICKTNNKTIEQILNKVYEIKGYVTKKGYLKSRVISFPRCMINRKFKIILVKE